jgi:hypothetical protein
MITPTPYVVDRELVSHIDDIEMFLINGRQAINEPTGRFFYDPWIIKQSWKNSKLEKLISVLPYPIGEARIIILKSATTYSAHADIDDRYHLNLRGEDSYLIDLEHKKLHPLKCDGVWYDMNAGYHHSAANFGRFDRVQLVVRKLLKCNKLVAPAKITIQVGRSSEDDSRFVFDRIISPYLNQWNKCGFLSDFQYENKSIQFNLEKIAVNKLSQIIRETDFKLFIS